MRVYVAATVPMLRELLDQGQVGGSPLRAFAVTPEVREWYQDGDEEELEYAALSAAAAGSVRLIDRDPTAVRRRVVIAADVAEGSTTPRPDLDRPVVELAAPVTLAQVAAVHVDSAEAEQAVRAAANVMIEADLGSADAQFVVDGAAGHELGWYATQEIGALVELL